MIQYASMIAVMTLVLGGSGCSTDTEGACERIIEACHEKDTGAGAAHDCHEFAEANEGDDDTCADREDDCLASCGAN